MKRIVFIAGLWLCLGGTAIALPTANFTYVHTNNGCLPDDTTIFTNTSTGAHIYRWDFGDFSPQYFGVDTAHAYMWNNIFTVTLTAYDTITGDSDVVMKPVEIAALPMPWFWTSPPNPVCPSTPVEFNTMMFPSPDSVKWYFGDGDSSSIMTPSHFYSDTGLFMVSLIAYNQCGSDTAINPVDIDSSAGPGVPGIWADKTTACPDEPIAFNLWLMPVPDSIVWVFGDGDSAFVQNPGHSYSAIGLYSVYAIVYNDCTSDTSATLGITIMNTLIPTVIASVFPDSVCPNDIVNFNGSTNGLQSWIWNFDDGDNSFLANTTHSYAAYGTYDAVFTGTNYCDSTRTDTVTIYVGDSVPPSLVDFNFSPMSFCPGFTEICPGTLVNFTNTSSSISSSFWDFDDSTTSSLTNPTHSFPDSNSYMVKLKVTSSCGGVDSITKCLLVSDDLVPNAWFCINPPMCFPSPTVCVGSLVTFQIWNTDTPSVIWDFGDGDSSFQTNPSHIYSATGSYIVTLRITNSCGKTNVQSQNITVSTTGTPPSMADFWSMPGSSCPGDPVNFNGWAMNATQWWWDFGDGDTSVMQNVNHTYSSSGNYTVTFVAKNGCGTDTVRKIYSVNAGSNPDFSFAPAGCYGVPIAFTDNSSPVPTSWQWDFGDGDTSTAQNPSHTFALEGLYNVTLMVSLTGCNSSVTKAINMIVDLSASSVNSTCNLPNGTATVNVLQGNPPYNYLWDAAAGSQTTSTATGLLAGPYWVTVTDARGCLDSIAIAVSNTNVPSADPTSASAAPATVCLGGSSTLTLAGGSLGTGASWKWYSASCGGTVEGSGASISPTPAATTTYYVRAEGVCNTTACVNTTVTVNPPATVNAGSDTTICESGSITLSGIIGGGASSATWSTSGDGLFDNPVLLAATYTPGNNDKTMGSVTLTLTTDDPAGPCPAVSDAMTLTINPAATVNAGSDATICEGSNYTLSGSRGGSATSSSWTTSGDGMFDDPNLLSATYTPGTNDKAMGSVALTLTTDDPAGPCPALSDAMTLTINPSATVNAGSDATICEGSAYALSGTRGGGATSSTWTTPGDGFFDNAALLAATYTPGPTDISMGSVTLTLTTDDPAGPCPAVSDAMTLTINPAATVNAGSDAIICEGSNYTLSGSRGGSATSSSWTTSGDGMFDDPNLLTATYTPGTNDKAMGNVTLTLTTDDPAGPCPAVSDAMTLTINPAATVNAGPVVTICEGSAYTLSGSRGGSATSSTWTTTGDGMFDNPALLAATYTPGAGDISMGSATLTLTTDDPAGPCLAVSDAMALIINPAAISNAGSDTTICAGGTYTLSGARGGGATSSAWATSGSGSFDDPSLLTAIYTPSPADTAAGCVTLTLTTDDPAGPCNAVSDFMILCFNPVDNPSFSYSSVIYCQSGVDPTPSVTGTPGGTFNSSPAGLIINSGTGKIDLDLSALGAYSVEYVTGGSCPDSSTVGITITAAFDATFSYATPFCQSDPNALPSFPVGASAGVFSSVPAGISFVNVNTGEINLGSGAAGVYDIENYIAPSGGCVADSFTFSITVNQAATASAGADASVCEGSLFTLSGTIGGGASSAVWATSGTGLFDNPSLLNATYTPSIADIAMGSVTLTILTDDPAGPCPAVSDAMTLTFLPLPAASTSVTDALCNGSCNGTASANGSGGTSPYNYLWDVAAGGQTTALATGLCAASYNVTVTDSKGCTGSAMATVGEPVVLTSSITATTDASCAGACDGSAEVTPAGGTPPYSYLWDPSAGAQTPSAATGLCAGTYGVTATDNNGCTTTSSATLGEPSALSLSTGTDSSTCGNSDGSAFVSASGGTPPYEYIWNDPLSQTNDTAVSLASGIYSVTVDDANGCTASGVAIISDIGGPAVSVSAVYNVSCAGGSDGVASTVVSGGTPPYTFLWSDPLSQTDSAATGLSAGTYFVTVSDFNSCQSITSGSVTEPPALTVSLSGIDANCSQSDGEATATAGGGTPAYSYVWSGGGTTAAVTGQPAGTHTVTVTDANGCTATGSVTLNDIPGVTVSSVTGNDLVCNGICTGSAAVAAIGGTLPYTYSWDDPLTQSTQSATGLCAGTFEVIIVDANNCSDTGAITITEPSALTATATATATLCAGSCDGSASVSASGGTSPYFYQWDDPLTQTDTAATGLCSGNFQVTVSDNNSCSVIASTTVNEPSSLAAVTGNINSTCGNSDGSAFVTVSGGTPPYGYAWDDPMNQVTDTAVSLASGSYSVTVDDANGCTVTGTAVVNDAGGPSMTVSVTSNVSCSGGSDGIASVSVSGGTPPFDYLWSDPLAQTDSSATGLTPGTYFVTVSDFNNCQSIGSATITEPSALSVSVTATDANCGQSNGSAAASAAGGSGTYSYLWNTGDSTSSINLFPSSIYTVTVSDANGCTTTGSATVNDIPGVSVSSVTGTDLACYNVCDGNATVNTAGGTLPYTYLWNDPLSQATPTATGLCAGTYIVVVTDANNCIDSGTITITEPTALTATANATATFCIGSCDGSATVAPTGGTGSYTYLWDAAAGGQTTVTATGLCNGTYTVTVNDFNGCTAVIAVSVGSPAPLALSFTTTDATCGSNDGIAVVSVTGGTSPYSYLWDNSQTTDTASGLAAGSYSVTVTDASGCTEGSSVILNNLGAPAVTIVSFSNVSCNGNSDGTATISISGGIPPYDVLWDSQTGNQTTLTATGLPAGNYLASVTDSNNCISFAPVTITQPAVLTSSVNSVADVSCSGAADGTADLNSGGGTAPYTYAWSSGAISEDIAGLAGGTYTLTVTDANSCTAVQTITVNEPAALSVSTAVTATSCMACDGSADASVSGGISPYSFVWDDPLNQTTSTATGLCATNYSVFVTDANGCTMTASATVPAPGGLTSSISASTDLICAGMCTGSATVSVAGGSPPYAVLWDDPSTQSSLIATGLCAGTYTATVADSNGCSTIAAVTITEPAALAVALNITNISCNGICDGAVSAFVTGGTGSYTYLWSTGSIGTGETTLCPGIYSVTVTDANNCVITSSGTVTEPAPLVISVATTDATCFGACDGSFTLGGSGGTPPYTGVGTSPAVCAGTYFVFIGDTNGCSASDTAYIFQPPLLSIDSVMSTKASCGDTTCPDGSAEVYASGGTGALTYQWSNGGNTDSITGLISATYYVTITDASGCTDTSSVFVDYLVTEFNHLPLITHHLLVYPNPVKDKLTLYFAPITKTDGVVEITDVLGKKVYSTIFEAGKPVVINVEGWSEGMYLVEVKGEYKVVNSRFAVCR